MRASFGVAGARRLHVLANLLVLTLTTFLLESDSQSADKGDECAPPTARYETVEHAVTVLSQCYLRRSVHSNREYMAALISDRDAVVTVVNRGRRGRDHTGITIRLKHGQALLALWHVHGSNGVERSLFSPTDADIVTQLQVPFYLTDPTGFVWRLDPQDISYARPTHQRMTALRAPPGSVEGIAVGHMNAGLTREDSSALAAVCQPSPTDGESPLPEIPC